MSIRNLQKLLLTDTPSRPSSTVRQPSTDSRRVTRASNSDRSIDYDRLRLTMAKTQAKYRLAVAKDKRTKKVNDNVKKRIMKHM